MFEQISQQTADQIKNILLNTQLPDKINFKIDKSDLYLNVNSVSETKNTAHFYYNMQEFYLLNNDKRNVIKLENSYSNLYINVGEWAYKTDLSDAHIVLGSDIFHSLCFQIELSQAVEDSNYIYIVKNIENFAGKGAINRLYGNTKNDRSLKERRKQNFIWQYNHERIEYENKSWVCIDKIKINELYDEEKRPYIFYSLLNNMTRAMLTVESIRISD